jgi:hypothetical protein
MLLAGANVFYDTRRVRKEAVRLTSMSAKTSTSTTIVTGLRNCVTPEPPTVNPALVVHHETWVKTADGWKESKGVLRCTMCAESYDV